MATEHTIKAYGRQDAGKGASRRLRRAGRIPAIVYGGHADPVSVELEHEKTWLASQNEWFYSSILTMDLDGKSQKVLLRDMQRHPYKQQIMHLDFQRVSENEALRAPVQLHFVNEETSPAGKAADVIIMHELTEVVVSCLPKDLPEYIEVDLGGFKLGDIVHLSDLKLPAGVEIPELKLGKEHDVAVAVAKQARVELADDAEGGDAAPAADVPATKVDDDAAPEGAA